MPTKSKKKVIVDTNCWISYLIGKRLSILTELLSNDRIELIVCDELISEIREVTSRRKFAKYFPKDDVTSLLSFLSIIGTSISYEENLHLCRDAADDWLLDLAITSNADYLITGDNDLLVLKNINKCLIVDIAAFEHIFKR